MKTEEWCKNYEVRKKFHPEARGQIPNKQIKNF